MIHPRQLISIRSIAFLLATCGGLPCPCSAGAATSGSAGPAARVRAEHPDVLLLTIDTLRFDHLGCYGYPVATSPTIDSLATIGARFGDCTVQWPKTWPSLTSLLSGCFPRTTGIRYGRRTLPPQLHLLAEVFSEAGYATAGVVSNFNVGKKFNFQQGFDTFVESWQERWRELYGQRRFRNQPGLVKRYTDAGQVVDQALCWLDERPQDRPFFMWLHFMDPHGPYVPPRKYGDLFRGAHPVEPVPPQVIPEYQRQRDGHGSVIDDLGFYKTQYDREIRYLDDELSRLLAGLRARGLWPGTLLVLTADHGESQGEHHYYLEHGKLSYQVNAHVPLLLVWDGHLAPDRLVEEPVGLIDLAPTLVELAGLPPVPTHEGVSLVPLLAGEPGARGPETIFMESGYHDPLAQRTVRRGQWKLIHVLAEEDRAAMTGSEWELYDLASDPGETRNLASARPRLVAELGGVLEEWLATTSPAASVAPEVDMEKLSDRDQEMLRSLGY
jgi:arylsulfatase A-like enzyme